MNFKDDILSKPSLVAYWRLGSYDTWKHDGVVDAIPQPVRRNLMLDPSFESNTSNWAGSGGFIGGTSALSLDPANALVGGNAMKVVTPATASAGAQSVQTLQLIGGVTYSISVYVKQQAGGSAISRIALAESNPPNAEYTIGGNVTFGTGYTRYQALITPARTGQHLVYVRQNNATASTFWIDAVACVPSTVDAGYADGDGVIQPRIFGQAQGAQVIGGGAAGGMPNDTLAGSTAFTATVADAIQVPHQAPLAIIGDMTVVAVLNVTSFPVNRGILSKLAANGIAAPYDMRINATTGAVILTVGNGTTNTGWGGGLAMPTGTPAMVAVTVSGTAVSIYRNGTQDGTTGSIAGQARADVGRDLHIGRRADFGDPFLGTIQDLATFNAALTANEILALAKEAGFA